MKHVHTYIHNVLCVYNSIHKKISVYLKTILCLRQLTESFCFCIQYKYKKDSIYIYISIYMHIYSLRITKKNLKIFLPMSTI